MLRKIIGIVLGLLIIVGSVAFARMLISNKKRPKSVVNKVKKTVFVDTVKNQTVPVFIEANGNLTAVRKVEVYSEVQGIFKETKKPFKAGQKFRKGELLIAIDGREFYSNLVAQRSSLFDLITTILPDLRFDYPDAYPAWKKYLDDFDLNSPVRSLPDFKTEKEKLFMNSKKVVSTYYSIKNLEERYAKYNIRAPFSGILTESLVNPGTLIRSGQKLGEFIDPLLYELEVSVNAAYSNMLAVGNEVELTDINKSGQWKGVVKRVNGKIDLATQTIKVYIEVKGQSLKEGMYLEAVLPAREEKDAIEISRKLLIDESHIFIVQDSVLQIAEVNPVYYTDKTAVIKGLQDGSVILERSVPGAYEGMLVEIFEEK